MDKEALKREQLTAYIPSTKRTWCNLHYNEKGCAYFIKYGYTYYIRDMVEIKY